MRRRAKVAIGGVSTMLVLALAATYLLAPGTLFLMRLMDGSSLAPDEGGGFTVEEVSLGGRDRSLRAKLYQPRSHPRRALLLLHGVHHLGYEEPRLTHFARRLALFGYTVLVPELEDLKHYDLHPRAVDEIERAARWLLDRTELSGAAADGRIGLLGISFAGGLGLGAAGRESLRGRLAFAFSFGGHADIDRTSHYLVTGELPGGGSRTPHVYGQAVILRQTAAALVAPDQVAGLREAVSVYLRGDRPRAEELGARLRPEAQHLLTLCVKRDTVELGRILGPLTASGRSDPALSPVRGSPPDCPVFLLHGVADNVIPPTETLALEAWSAPHTETHALVSEAIEHVELSDDQSSAGLLDYYRIARFWTRMLRI